MGLKNIRESTICEIAKAAANLQTAITDIGVGVSQASRKIGIQNDQFHLMLSNIYETMVSREVPISEFMQDITSVLESLKTDNKAFNNSTLNLLQRVDRYLQQNKSKYINCLISILTIVQRYPQDIIRFAATCIATK